jgi:hypothetical protein
VVTYPALTSTFLCLKADREKGISEISVLDVAATYLQHYPSYHLYNMDEPPQKRFKVSCCVPKRSDSADLSSTLRTPNKSAISVSMSDVIKASRGRRRSLMIQSRR